VIRRDADQPAPLFAQPATPAPVAAAPHSPPAATAGYYADWVCACGTPNSGWGERKAQLFCSECRTDCPDKFIRPADKPCTPPRSSSPSAQASPSASPAAAPASSSTPSATPSPTPSTSSTTDDVHVTGGRREVTDKRAAELKLRVGKCEKCGARILFSRTTKGAAVPLQAHALQVYVIEKDGHDEPTGRVEFRAAFHTHFVDCPHSEHFRRPK